MCVLGGEVGEGEGMRSRSEDNGQEEVKDMRLRGRGHSVEKRMRACGRGREEVEDMRSGV